MVDASCSEPVAGCPRVVRSRCTDLTHDGMTRCAAVLRVLCAHAWQSSGMTRVDVYLMFFSGELEYSSDICSYVFRTCGMDFSVVGVPGNNIHCKCMLFVCEFPT